MNYALGSAMVFGITHSIRLVPESARNKFAEKMGEYLGTSDQEFSSTVIANLAGAFPHLGRKAIFDLAVANAYKTSQAQLDFLWAWRASGSAIRKRVSLQGQELVKSSVPPIVVGTHQLGFEVASLRLSMQTAGGVIIDPGSEKLPASAYKAWSRFNPQTIIEPKSALRQCRDVLRAGKPVLMLVDQPPGLNDEFPTTTIGKLQPKISPIVTLLRSRTKHPVLWMDISDRSDKSGYDVLNRQLAENPSGYWWARKILPTENRPETGIKKVQ